VLQALQGQLGHKVSKVQLDLWVQRDRQVLTLLFQAQQGQLVQQVQLVRQAQRVLTLQFLDLLVQQVQQGQSASQEQQVLWEQQVLLEQQVQQALSHQLLLVLTLPLVQLVELAM
jgi:hypothetical protein